MTRQCQMSQNSCINTEWNQGILKRRVDVSVPMIHWYIIMYVRYVWPRVPNACTQCDQCPRWHGCDMRPEDVRAHHCHAAPVTGIPGVITIISDHVHNIPACAEFSTVGPLTFHTHNASYEIKSAGKRIYWDCFLPLGPWILLLLGGMAQGNIY